MACLTNMPHQEILDLKAEGKSLREIASNLGISHIAVLKRLRSTGNQVVTKKNPNLTPYPTITPSQKRICKAKRGKKGVSSGVSSEVDGLFESIRQFLKANGIEVYRMETEPEVYQVKHNGQVIRLYVQRKK